MRKREIRTLATTLVQDPKSVVLVTQIEMAPSANRLNQLYTDATELWQLDWKTAIRVAAYVGCLLRDLGHYNTWREENPPNIPYLTWLSSKDWSAYCWLMAEDPWRVRSPKKTAANPLPPWGQLL